ncbi:MAG: SBBP repeat-containing protein [Bacteroidota bacterium]
MRLILLILLAFTLLGKLQSKATHEYVGYIENKGQIIDQNRKLNPGVKYLYNGNGLNVQLRTNGFSYDIFTVKKSIDYTGSLFHRIDIKFIGANMNPTIVADKANIGYTNYYTTSTNEEGITFVKTYQHITYKNLYKGIDLEFLLDENDKPKYNFIIHAGADASQIKWQYGGSNKISFEEKKIILGTSLGDLHEKIPLSYIFESRTKLEVSYQLEKKDTSFSFLITSYDPTKTLIIDPIPWATYFGTSQEDISWAVSTVSNDANGNVFTGGSMFSNFIATADSNKIEMRRVILSCFIAKFSDVGTYLWTTYYGTEGDELADIIVDKNDEIYACGRAISWSNIATVGAHQFEGSINGGNMAYLTKFNTLGIRQWGTFYGKPSSTTGTCLASDFAGNIYMGGYTTSKLLIATPGTYQADVPAIGSYEGFIVKFNSLGTRLWGTYYGGSKSDYIEGIAVDVNENVYVCGLTQSNDKIATVGTYQSTLSIGNNSAFIAKLDSYGRRLWGTYYGNGIGTVTAYDIITDKKGYVYVCGYAEPTTGIATTNAYMVTLSGPSDGFLSKFDSLGMIVWGTYYGGPSGDGLYAISIDANGDIYACGETGSLTKIATNDALQTSHGGGDGDAFLVKFSHSGSRLYATYFGGKGNDRSFDLNIDIWEGVFICGSTNSETNIATNGAYQAAYGGGANDVFLASIIAPYIVIPDKIIDLKGKREEEGILLTWKIPTSINSALFIVERSLNNSDWTNIGIIKKNSSSSIANQYQYIDTTLSRQMKERSKLYYRLKQRDVSGNFEYSKILFFQEEKEDIVYIVPNPFTDELLISQNRLVGVIKVEMLDMMGIVCLSQYIDPSIEQVKVSTAHLKTGMYIVKVYSNDIVQAQKMIKQ